MSVQNNITKSCERTFGAVECSDENCEPEWSTHVITYDCKSFTCKDKKAKMHKLLHVEEDNLISNPDNPCPENHIRYIHLPANNMKWVEVGHVISPRSRSKFFSLNSRKEVMTRYYKFTGNERRKEELLKRELWHGQQHGTSGPVHARFMRPRCMKVPQDSSLHQSSNIKKHDDFVLFMPYLHWEADTVIKKMGTVVNDITSPNAQTVASRVVDDKLCRREETLYRKYLFGNSPLHIRRTLDQYYYWTLKDTSQRDADQVVYRATQQSKEGARIIMVDQLWLWVLDGQIVLTAVPRRGGKHNNDSSGIHRNLRDKIPKSQYESVWSLAIAVIDQCSRVFFDRTQPEDERPEMMDLFANAIGNITDNLTKAYENFWALIREDSEEYQKDVEYRHKIFKSRSNVLEDWNHVELAVQIPRPNSEDSRRIRRQQLLDINPEGVLSREIKDILDELHIVQKVYSEQHSVVKEFEKLLCSSNGHTPEVPKDARVRARDLVVDIEKRAAEIEMLIKAATHTAKGLKELLELKQMQANVSEARDAVIQSEQANESAKISMKLAIEARRQTLQGAKQNKSLFLFTVVTIIFLPLGFFASVFGMNNMENGQGNMAIKTQFAIMFPASLAIITLSFTLAFSAGVSIFCLFGIRIMWAYLLKATGILNLWHRYGIRDWKSLENQQEEMVKKIYGGKKPIKCDV